MIFILSSISRGLGGGGGGGGGGCECSESNVFKNKKFSGEIINNWRNHVLERNVYKTL